ncbi:MAG: hypothetical protein Q9181_005081, partial [Wetmoreana brouardii]
MNKLIPVYRAADQGLPPTHPDYCFCDGTTAPLLTHTNGKTDCDYKTQPASNIPLGTMTKHTGSSAKYTGTGTGAAPSMVPSPEPSSNAGPSNPTGGLNPGPTHTGGALPTTMPGHTQQSFQSSGATGPSGTSRHSSGELPEISSGTASTVPNQAQHTQVSGNTILSSGKSGGTRGTAEHSRTGALGSTADGRQPSSGTGAPRPLSTQIGPSNVLSGKESSGTGFIPSSQGPEHTGNTAVQSSTGGAKGSSNQGPHHTSGPPVPGSTGGGQGPSNTHEPNPVTSQPAPGHSSGAGQPPVTRPQHPSQTQQYSVTGLFQPSYTSPLAVVTNNGYVETYNRQTYSDLTGITAVTTVTTTYESTGTGGAVAIATGPVIVGPGGVWWKFGGSSGGGGGGGGPP